MTGSGNFPPGRALRPEVRMNKEQEEAVGICFRCGTDDCLQSECPGPNGDMYKEEAVMKRAEVTREHREQAYLLIHERHSLLPGPMSWIETGHNDRFGDFSMSARVAQAIADAEARGAAAQQRLITNTLFGGFIEGPLVDDAIALSQRVNAARKADCAAAWDECFQDRQQPTNPYRPKEP